VTFVVVFHVFQGTLPSGSIGVDVFFVISGFLITTLLVDEFSERDSVRLRDFWRRRARRLLPALGVLVLFCSAVAAILGGEVLIGLGRQVIGAVTFSSNWLSIFSGSSYFDQTLPELFRNLWSLAVEEQFYVIWPLLLLLVLRARKTWVRVGVLSLIAIASAVEMGLVYSPESDPTRVYYGTDTHSFGLALGAAIAIGARSWPTTTLAWNRRVRRALIALGAVAIVALFAFAVFVPGDSAFIFVGGLPLVALLSGAAIVGAILPDSVVGRVLDWRPLAWVGKRSYGLYLWHWPIGVLVLAALPTLATDGLGTFVSGLIVVGITIVAATASYRFVETPIRREGFRSTIRRWVGRRPRSRARTGLAAIAVSAFIGIAAFTSVTVAQAPQLGAAEAAIEAGQASVDGQNSAAPAPANAPSRIPGSIATGPEITAIGDSVLLASAPELQKAFPGIYINAKVSRQMMALPSLVKRLKDAGKLRSTVVIALGTNGGITRDFLDHARDIIGQNRDIVVVNVQAPRYWTNSVNSILSTFASDYRNVELSNWHAAIAPKIWVLAPDQIHPGGAGGRIYVKALTSALERLAHLPPMPTFSGGNQLHPR
jgi:peptidoglycan/LPS O-acetylase OafA/YrhL